MHNTVYIHTAIMTHRVLSLVLPSAAPSIQKGTSMYVRVWACMGVKEKMLSIFIIHSVSVFYVLCASLTSKNLYPHCLLIHAVSGRHCDLLFASSVQLHPMAVHSGLINTQLNSIQYIQHVSIETTWAKRAQAVEDKREKRGSKKEL